MTLPKKYQQAMQDLLGEEYSAYIESMQQRSQTAIRINTAKISLEQWAEICPFKTKPVPWTEKGFLTTDEQCNPAKHPYYYAGLYYIQEPSAMIPASILPVHEGDRILDVCAAPGARRQSWPRSCGEPVNWLQMILVFPGRWHLRRICRLPVRSTQSLQQKSRNDCKSPFYSILMVF